MVLTARLAHCLIVFNHSGENSGIIFRNGNTADATRYLNCLLPLCVSCRDAPGAALSRLAAKWMSQVAGEKPE